MSDLTALAGQALADGCFAVIACIGFALISNAPPKVCRVAGVLAGLGHMARFLLLHQGMGMASASLCAATLISLCSMACARRRHIPAEFLAFPALLPMIPGMYAYNAILATMRFLSASDAGLRQMLLIDIAHNALTTFFVMGALVIGAIVPLFALHDESPLFRRRRAPGRTESDGDVPPPETPDRP